MQALRFTLGLVDLLTHEKLPARDEVRRSEENHLLVLGTAEEVADQIIELCAGGTVDGYTCQQPRAHGRLVLLTSAINRRKLSSLSSFFQRLKKRQTI